MNQIGGDQPSQKQHPPATGGVASSRINDKLPSSPQSFNIFENKVARSIIQQQRHADSQ